MFNRFILIVFILYVLIVSNTVFFCISDIPFRADKRMQNIRNLNRIKILVRVVLVSITITLSIFIMLPIYKDKQLLLHNSYECTHGIVYQEVVGGGAYDLFKTIIVDVDGDNINYNVLYAEKNIKKGDMVKVTYLPNSMYAIVEMD
mgnify:FL=1